MDPRPGTCYLGLERILENARLMRICSALPVGFLGALATLLVGCATSPPQDPDQQRAELDAMADETVEALIEAQPSARDVLDRSLGYVVIDMRVTKIPMIGAGNGLGVVVDRRTDTRAYLKVTRFDIGGGWGAQHFKVIVVFEDGKLLDRAKSGAWHYEAGAEVAAGTTSVDGTAQTASKGFQAYRLAEGGAAAPVTVRVARARPFLD
jgi:lipid-binding SYLF domain-containing protein